MGKALLSILLGMLIFLPVYIVLYISEREAARDADNESQNEKLADLRLKHQLVEVRCRRILYDAWKALQMAGTGAYYLTTAIKAEELDQETALAAVWMSFKDSMQWRNDSTPETKAHWDKIAAIHARAEELIKRAGA